MDAFLLVFAATLLVAVLVSAIAHRTVLSTAVIFLAVGVVLGSEPVGILSVGPESDTVSALAQLALFVVLFTDGMRLDWPRLRGGWRAPARLLGWGLPLTLGITAVLAHLLLGLTWPESLLIGAILAPTDPVFAAAIVGNDAIPARLRGLLNVESGLNDGLALPLVMVFLALSGGNEVPLWVLAIELVGGAALGAAVSWLTALALRIPGLGTSDTYRPIAAVAVGTAVFAIAQFSGANLYLAAFTAGVTLATVAPAERRAFEPIGDVASEVLKLLALMVFGALFSFGFLAEVPLGGWVLAVLALVVARPVAVFLASLRSDLGPREQLTAMWFGPKGFASVVYVLIVYGAGISSGELIFHVVAITIMLSIVAHSTTDVIVARAFRDREVPV